MFCPAVFLHSKGLISRINHASLQNKVIFFFPKHYYKNTPHQGLIYVYALTTNFTFWYL